MHLKDRPHNCLSWLQAVYAFAAVALLLAPAVSARQLKQASSDITDAGQHPRGPLVLRPMYLYAQYLQLLTCFFCRHPQLRTKFGVP